MSNNTGGPAFPTETFQVEGMTLRDYFAAKTMQGFAVSPDVSWPHLAEMAALSYKWADAMLKARVA